MIVFDVICEDVDGSLCIDVFFEVDIFDDVFKCIFVYLVGVFMFLMINLFSEMLLSIMRMFILFYDFIL